ncbi:hypothetical protein ACWCRB_46580, partial [Streptomyces sp. NPDC002156]
AALHSQLAAALSVVLHLARDRAGRRRIAEVHMLERDSLRSATRASTAVLQPCALREAEPSKRSPECSPCGLRRPACFVPCRWAVKGELHPERVPAR